MARNISSNFSCPLVRSTTELSPEKDIFLSLICLTISVSEVCADDANGMKTDETKMISVVAIVLVLNCII